MSCWTPSASLPVTFVVILVLLQHLIPQIHTKLNKDAKGAAIIVPNTAKDIFICEDCGHGEAEAESCFGSKAIDPKTYKHLSGEEKSPNKQCGQDQDYHCSRKFIIRGPDDLITPEIQERRACIPTTPEDPPYFGCNISDPNFLFTPGTTVECFCNEEYGREIAQLNDTAADYPAWYYQIGFEYCNSRIQCFQCTDCLIPENPQLCERSNGTGSSGDSQFVEMDFGRISFCTVEVKDGVVKRGCAENPINYPNSEWPDCRESHWDHFYSRCKCFGQRCNANFFYTNENLGGAWVRKRALTIPTPAFQRKDRDYDEDGKPKKLTCHTCKQDPADTAKGLNSCLKKADENDPSQWIECPNEDDVCFRDYIYDADSSLLMKKYMINKKGCIKGPRITRRGQTKPQLPEDGDNGTKTTEKEEVDSTTEGDTGGGGGDPTTTTQGTIEPEDDNKDIQKPSRKTLEIGWFRDYNIPQTPSIKPPAALPQPPRKPRITFYCNTDKCNVASKCHQCSGSGTRCDTVINATLLDCNGEFLLPGETQYTAGRSTVGVAHYCTVLTTGNVLSRACSAAIDFGTRSGYFGHGKYFPDECDTWGWEGVNKEAKYQECACGGEGCNSKEIISIRPPQLMVNLTRSAEGTKSGKGTGGRVVGSDAKLLFVLVSIVAPFIVMF